MKYKLISVSTVPAINIGDYVQALASSQFYPQVDGFIEREALKEYTGEECKVIMNAYYMHDSLHWPPAHQIKPLFVAMHINSLVRERFALQDSINYLKEYNMPIGCRDLDTKDFLEKNGVDSYFSGCLTLTLGQKYKYTGNRSGVYFVDPKVTFKNRFEKMYYYLLSFCQNSQVKKIGQKYYKKTILSAHERSYVSKFLSKYSKLFTVDTIMDAEYISQESAYYNNTFRTNEALLSEAERLVKLYSTASLVVTSRIHCALPCMGLETPVLLINNGEQKESSACRLRGLRELFNVLNWTNAGIKANFEHTGKLSVVNHPNNKETWRPLAKDLIEKCTKFIYD